MGHSRLLRAGSFALVLILAVALRLAGWSDVFTPRGIRLAADGDAYYHALRARVLAQEHRVLWRDHGLSSPTGAEVPWPPLFDLLIAAPAWMAGGAAPTSEAVERAAALVPVAMAVLATVAVGVLALELLGAWGAVLAALAFAVSPTSVIYGSLGRSDHHVLEVFLLAVLLAAYARGLGAKASRWSALAIAVPLTAMFWTWIGSPFHVVVLCVLVFVDEIVAASRPGVAGRAAPLVGSAMAASAVLGAATIALLGPPGALGRMSPRGLSALQPILAAAAAAWCAAMAAAARRFPDAGPARRAAQAVVAGAVIAGALLAVPGVWSGLGLVTSAAGQADHWAFAAEGQSAASGSLTKTAGFLLDSYGLLPLLAVAGLGELTAWWRSPERRPAAALVATLAIVFGVLTAYMNRFSYYVAVPLALLAAMGIAAIARWRPLRGRTAPVFALVAGVLGVGTAAAAAVRMVRTPEPARARFEAVFDVLAPLRDGRLPNGGALLSRWDAGHHARYFSGRPVVATPFGTDVGREALDDSAAFFLAEDPASAFEVLRRREVRWVLLEDPAEAVLESAKLTRAADPPVTLVHDPAGGTFIHCEERYDRLVAARLYYEAGSSSPANRVALGGYRLVSEAGAPGGRVTRLFEVVQGASLEVRGARPDRAVFATVVARTALGSFQWSAAAVADAAGRASVRVPYATGLNGAVLASAYTIADGTRQAVRVVSDAQVLGGMSLSVDLSASGTTP